LLASVGIFAVRSRNRKRRIGSSMLEGNPAGLERKTRRQ
jgi:tRNA (Thr-GGU) A37 N-methylase